MQLGRAYVKDDKCNAFENERAGKLVRGTAKKQKVEQVKRRSIFGNKRNEASTL